MTISLPVPSQSGHSAGTGTISGQPNLVICPFPLQRRHGLGAPDFRASGSLACTIDPPDIEIPQPILGNRAEADTMDLFHRCVRAWNRSPVRPIFESLGRCVEHCLHSPRISKQRPAIDLLAAISSAGGEF